MASYHHISITEVLNGELSKSSQKLEIRVKIVSCLDDGRFKIQDEKASCTLKVQAPGLNSNPFLKVGKFVKIMKPQLCPTENCLVLADDSKIIPTKSFKLPEENVVSSSTFEDSAVTALSEIKNMEMEKVIIENL